MRIIAGKFKGRKLPELKAGGVRPTLDRVRENLFNIIFHEVSGATFLDLFSGSGAVGFEALSRGASEVVLCDKSRDVVAHLKKVASMLGASPSIICADYKSVLDRLPKQKFDIIYLDPPYEMDGRQIIEAVLRSEVVKDDGLIVYERESSKTFDGVVGLEIVDERKYGVATLCFLRLKNA